MKRNHINRETLSCSLNPDIIKILDYSREHYFYRTRSKLIERIFLDWLESENMISHSDRVLLENCYKEGV